MRPRLPFARPLGATRHIPVVADAARFVPAKGLEEGIDELLTGLSLLESTGEVSILATLESFNERKDKPRWCHGRPPDLPMESAMA